MNQKGRKRTRIQKIAMQLTQQIQNLQDQLKELQNECTHPNAGEYCNRNFGICDVCLKEFEFKTREEVGIACSGVPLHQVERIRSMILSQN